jgi:hypothetical protein
MAVTGYKVAGFIKALTGIFHQKLIDFIAGGHSVGHLIAEVVCVDFAIDADEYLFIDWHATVSFLKD